MLSICILFSLIISLIVYSIFLCRLLVVSFSKESMSYEYSETSFISDNELILGHSSSKDYSYSP